MTELTFAGKLCQGAKYEGKDNNNQTGNKVW